MRCMAVVLDGEQYSPLYLMCGPWTSGISIKGQLARKVESQAPSQTC